MNKSLALVALAVSLHAGETTAEALVANEHWKRARDLLEAEIKSRPNDARVNCLLAQALHALGRLDDAARYAEAAVRLDPKLTRAHRELGEIYADQAEN